MTANRSPSVRRLYLGLPILLAAIFVLLLPGASVYYRYSGGRSCTRCHEIWQPYTDWHTSTHRNVPCSDCHGDVFTFDLGFHLKNIHRLVAHLSGDIPEQVRLKNDDVLRMGNRCQKCHQQAQLLVAERPVEDPRKCAPGSVGSGHALGHDPLDLKQLAKTRATQRKARRRRDLPRVAVVGYTNAGKSTLNTYIHDAWWLRTWMRFWNLVWTVRRVPDRREVADASPLRPVAALRNLLRPRPVVGLGLQQPVRDGSASSFPGPKGSAEARRAV